MPFGLLLGGISGLAGLFGGGQQQQNKSSSTSSQSGTTSQSGGSTQNLTNNLSGFQQMIASLMGNQANNVNQNTNLQPYTAAGEQQINQNSNLNNQVLQNSLASRGLQYSPAAATATNQNQLARTGQISQLQNSVPLLQRQLQTQALGSLSGAFSALPTNRSITGSTNMTGSTSQQGTSSGVNTQTGNPLAGLFGGLGGGLAAAANNPYQNPLGNLFNPSSW